MIASCNDTNMTPHLQRCETSALIKSTKKYFSTPCFRRWGTPPHSCSWSCKSCDCCVIMHLIMHWNAGDEAPHCTHGSCRAAPWAGEFKIFWLAFCLPCIIYIYWGCAASCLSCRALMFGSLHDTLKFWFWIAHIFVLSFIRSTCATRLMCACTNVTFVLLHVSFP